MNVTVRLSVLDDGGGEASLLDEVAVNLSSPRLRSVT